MLHIETTGRREPMETSDQLFTRLHREGKLKRMEQHTGWKMKIFMMQGNADAELAKLGTGHDSTAYLFRQEQPSKLQGVVKVYEPIRRLRPLELYRSVTQQAIDRLADINALIREDVAIDREKYTVTCDIVPPVAAEERGDIVGSILTEQNGWIRGETLAGGSDGIEPATHDHLRFSTILM